MNFRENTVGSKKAQSEKLASPQLPLHVLSPDKGLRRHALSNFEDNLSLHLADSHERHSEGVIY